MSEWHTYTDKSLARRLEKFAGRARRADSVGGGMCAEYAAASRDCMNALLRSTPTEQLAVALAHREPEVRELAFLELGRRATFAPSGPTE